MWKLKIVDDQDNKTVVNLVREDYSIGRAPDSAIRLTERNVSRRHATLRRTQSGYRVEDLHSYNGVYVNGVRVASRQELGHRDLIQLGDYRIQVIDEALETQEQSFSPYPGGTVMPASGKLPHRLVVLIGPEQGSEFPLEGDRFLVGRGEECEFVIDHASVSRVHAEIRALEGGHFEIIDKGSANGLRINGHERPRALLDGRDVIELGDVALKYIAQGQVFHADARESHRIVQQSATPVLPAQRRGRLSLPTILTALLGGGALVALGVVLLLPSSPATPLQVTARPNPSSGEGRDSARTALAPALELLESGDVERAHQAVLGLPGSSAERSSTEFSAIEAAWARSTIARAEAEADATVKQQLLDLVSKTETVPSELRQQAIDVMNRTADDAVALDEIEGNSQASKQKP